MGGWDGDMTVRGFFWTFRALPNEAVIRFGLGRCICRNYVCIMARRLERLSSNRHSSSGHLCRSQSTACQVGELSILTFILSEYETKNRVAAQLELDFNSVERVTEYLNVPQEAPAIIEKCRPPAYWPSSNGQLVVEDLVVKYAPHLPPVLRNLTFTVEAREKIGVVCWPANSFPDEVNMTSRWEGQVLVSQLCKLPPVHLKKFQGNQL